jgi:hypothetical protein
MDHGRKQGDAGRGWSSLIRLSMVLLTLASTPDVSPGNWDHSCRKSDAPLIVRRIHFYVHPIKASGERGPSRYSFEEDGLSIGCNRNAAFT